MFVTIFLYFLFVRLEGIDISFIYIYFFKKAKFKYSEIFFRRHLGGS